MPDEHTFRSDHLHTLMELVDQQVHAIPGTPESQGYIDYLKDVHKKVFALWATILPGQEAVCTIREQKGNNHAR